MREGRPLPLSSVPLLKKNWGSKEIFPRNPPELSTIFFSISQHLVLRPLLKLSPMKEWDYNVWLRLTLSEGADIEKSARRAAAGM